MTASIMYTSLGLNLAYVHRVHCYLLKKTLIVCTLSRLGLLTKLFVLNPKACTVVELYGVLDPITRDWTDGLLSNIFRYSITKLVEY